MRMESKVVALALAAGLAFCLAGCQEKSANEKVHDAVDNAADATKEAVHDAGQAVKEAGHDVGDAVEDATK